MAERVSTVRAAKNILGTEEPIVNRIPNLLKSREPKQRVETRSIARVVGETTRSGRSTERRGQKPATEFTRSPMLHRKGDGITMRQELLKDPSKKTIQTIKNAGPQSCGQL